MARFKIISDSGVKIVALWKEKNNWSNLTNSYYRSRAVRIAVCCSTCASTISAAGSRGTHCVELMCKIVSELTKAGMSDGWIMKNIGMDKDELLRYKQISGLAELFADKEFSLTKEI